MKKDFIAGQTITIKTPADPTRLPGVTPMNLKDYKEELMRDPEFAKAYEELQPEMEAEVDAIKAALAAPAP